MKRAWTFYCAVFLGAFLLFQIQPMASKALLPAFGGSYLVWGSCMVFFQAMLVLGYLYSHLVQRQFGVARYSRIHVAVLLLPFLFFPFRFESFTEVAAGRTLVPAVFATLFITLSVPFLVLSTASVILQRWLSVSDLPQKENPYALYAASNLGSMLALLTYPILVEPFFDLVLQGLIWWAAYASFVVLHVCCMPRPVAASAAPERAAAIRIPRMTLAAWLALSAAGCAMLLAVTNVLTFDVASIPFLWVLPLSVYLFTFVLVFKRRPWCPPWMERAFPVTVILGILLHLMAQLRLSLEPWIAVPLHLAILFVVCLNCASRLIKSKPDDPVHLTTYYLAISIGGFLGSAVVSWIVPVVSTSFVEYPLAFAFAVFAVGSMSCRTSAPAEWGRGWRSDAWFLLMVVAMVVIATLLPRFAGRYLDINGPRAPLMLVVVGAPIALVLGLASARPARLAFLLFAATIAMTWTEDLAVGAQRIIRLRNFYGIYKVFDLGNDRYLKHGTVEHGRQHLIGPRTQMPLAYYHPTTPISEAMRSKNFQFTRIGMIGLGPGALAGYINKDQEFIVYELDPDNLPVARDNFTYLDAAEKRGATLKYVFGDGRLSLSREEPRSLDLLVVDAFNSGSIPVHLMTVEAFGVYLRAVGRDGLVLMHVSNNVLDLIPVAYANALAAGAGVCDKNNVGFRHPDAEDTYWVAITRNQRHLDLLTGKMEWVRREFHDGKLPRPWTDQTSNLIGAMF